MYVLSVSIKMVKYEFFFSGEGEKDSIFGLKKKSILSNLKYT